MILRVNPELSGRPDLSGPSGALFGSKDEAELPLARALAGRAGGRAMPDQFQPYTGYADWVRNSNSAARFREAFALADQMDPPIKIACVEKIYRLANAEWQEALALSSPGRGTSPPSDRGQT